MCTLFYVCTDVCVFLYLQALDWVVKDSSAIVETTHACIHIHICVYIYTFIKVYTEMYLYL